MSDIILGFKTGFAILMLFIAMVERPGEGEAKKKEVVDAILQAVSGKVPALVESLLKLFLPLAIDYAVGFMKRNKMFEQIESFLTTSGLKSKG